MKPSRRLLWGRSGRLWNRKYQDYLSSLAGIAKMRNQFFKNGIWVEVFFGLIDNKSSWTRNGPEVWLYLKTWVLALGSLPRTFSTGPQTPVYHQQIRVHQFRAASPPIPFSSSSSAGRGCHEHLPPVRLVTATNTLQSDGRPVKPTRVGVHRTQSRATNLRISDRSQ